MKARIKKLWIKALLSGKYLQGKNYLRQVEGGKETYCCLGVLCDLHRKETKKKGWKALGNTYHYGSKEKGSNEQLPDSVAKWAGIKRGLGDEDEHGLSGYYSDNGSSLAADNDAGKTFSEIAEIIKVKL